MIKIIIIYLKIKIFKIIKYKYNNKYNNNIIINNYMSPELLKNYVNIK